VAFALAFSAWSAEHFVAQGIVCLKAGVVMALPAAAGIWLLLRRAYAVNPTAAGFVRGTLAGLAGVAMLELHCPLFEAPHAIVWHIAVLPVCGLAGTAAQKLLARGGGAVRRPATAD
jgi:hypothetical protein